MSGNRNIFEEVGESTKAEVRAAPAPTDLADMSGRRQVARWLFVLFLLLVVMILVGGLTRLTDSGLSITEWAPISGAIPPLTAAAWEAEFLKYQAIPEFQLVNKNMSLADFKYIYWWEWGHRQLGRVLGLVWAAGFIWFAVKKTIPRGWMVRLALLGVLGGLQGFIGWWMVSSGLEGRAVDVASYRLATHLGLAFVILGLIIWYMFQLKRPEMELFQARRRRETGMMPIANILVGLVFVQILLGALVAGLDAGRGYIDWPLMNGQILPDESFADSPLWRNFFENEALTQFNHRLVGYALLAFAVFAFLRARASALTAIRSNFKFALIFISAQAVWGIITVIYAAPLSLAIGHQLGAILVWIIVLRARFEVVYPGAQSLRA
jgi:cytochrome c oxidase assembly protein subunit 15